uniref:Methyltransf_21 domain-containing protein n=1 Tax=Steinernema glaseri TaxID=37863 RepID=A0A1I7YTU3_9BILA
MEKRQWLALALLAVAVLLVIVLSMRSNTALTMAEHKMHSHSWCIEQSLVGQPYLDIWTNLEKIVASCEEWGALNVSLFVPLETSYGTKYHLLPEDPEDAFDNCMVLSIGVGGHIEAELELKKLQPKCRFIGVDPDAERNEQLYTSIGQFYPYAVVGVKDGDDAMVDGRHAQRCRVRIKPET